MTTTLRFAAFAAILTVAGIASAQVRVNVASNQFLQAQAQATALLRAGRITPAQYQTVVQNILKQQVSPQTQYANGYNRMAQGYAAAAVTTSQANMVQAYNGRQMAQNDQVRAYNDRLRAAGETALRRSQSRINDGIAESKELDNEFKKAQQFHAKRAMHEAYAASQRPDPVANNARARRIVAAKRPERLSNSQFDRSTGTIDFPATLKTGEMASGCGTVQALVSMTVRSTSEDRTDLVASAREEIAVVKTQLKSQIRLLSPSNYVAARSFLDSLDYELNLIASGDTSADSLVAAR